MTTVKKSILIIFATLFFSNHIYGAYEDNLAITTDKRIRTYIYSPDEVFLVVVHYGFQSHIEFAKNEEIQSITLGDSYAWKITPMGNRLFIKPMEKHIHTNMTVITSKKTYQFDIVAKELKTGYDSDLMYVVRFYYPKNNFKGG